MTRRPAVLVLAVAALALGACSKKQPPPVVTPTPTVNQDSLRAAREAEAARMRADSIQREEAAARAAAEEAMRTARATLTETVFFDYDQFDIKAETADVLRRKVEVLQANPSVAMRIVGHADERGSVEYNLALGLRRANAVKDFLTGFNLDPSRFMVETMGEQQPLDPNQNEDAYAKNRRAEFQVTAGGDNLRTGR
jgi:peptidoglycan-associated lipoprotein